MPRDLYISTYTPALGSGRAMRTYTCVRALATLGPLDLAYVPHGGDGPSAEYMAIDGLHLYPIDPSRGLGRASTYASMCIRGVPRRFARGVSPELVRDATHLALAPGRGRVIVDDTSAAAALLPLTRRRQIIYNAHNVVGTYFDPTLSNTPISRMVFTAFERRLLRYFAECWVVSRRDLRAAHGLVPEANLRYVPNAVDVARITPVATTARSRTQLLMVGDFHYPPNRTGRAFLVEEVLPRVWRELPETRLLLVGRGSDDWISPDERIEVAGFVDDLAEVYARSDCVVVPITTGGGSPLKFVEALAYQVPVVATPFAAQGLEVTAGKHYLKGTDAPSFADAIVDVLRMGAPEVAAEGRKLAETEYSVQALAERLTAPLESSHVREHPPRA